VFQTLPKGGAPRIEWRRRLRFVELGVCSLSSFIGSLPLGIEELRFRSVGSEWALSSSSSLSTGPRFMRLLSSTSLSSIAIDSLMLNLRQSINLETPEYNRF